MNERDRGAGPLAALRGLRPLSVHARREERDADALRDRLPAGYAEAQPAAFSMLGSRPCSGAAPTPAWPAPSSSCRPPASATRRPSASLELGPVDPRGAGARAAPCARPSAFRSTRAGELRGRVAMRAELLSPSLARHPPLRAQRDRDGRGPRRDQSRGDALRHSLISTHPLLEVEGGRFVSPLEREGPEGEAVARQPSRSTPSGAARRRGQGGSRGRDRAPGPSGARAGESRQPVRQHGDRGGAAAPRACASARTSGRDLGSGPGGQEMIERAEATTGEDILACTAG